MVAFITVALIACIAITFSSAISRTGGSADTGEANRLHAERVLATAASAETEAKTAYDEATEAAKTECATGRGKLCDKAEDRREAAAARLDKARNATVVAKDPKKDPFYSRASALTQGRITKSSSGCIGRSWHRWRWRCRLAFASHSAFIPASRRRRRHQKPQKGGAGRVSHGQSAVRGRKNRTRLLQRFPSPQSSRRRRSLSSSSRRFARTVHSSDRRHR